MKNQGFQKILETKKLYRKPSPTLKKSLKLKGTEDFLMKNNFRNFANLRKTPDKSKIVHIESTSKSFDPFFGRPRTNKSRGNNTP